MSSESEENLTEQKVQSALKNIIRDGVASQAMGILTGGAFLTAFAVKLGASNFVIGLLAAIGPLSQLLQLPSIFLVEKIRNRRLIMNFLFLKIWGGYTDRFINKSVLAISGPLFMLSILAWTLKT
ncbi:MAG TPA: hypothetical protein HPP87_06970 [Planctomycetes bacterium]|nr:hypothetical protein [Planctomycetota bacterium]